MMKWNVHVAAMMVFCTAMMGKECVDAWLCW